MEVNILNSYFRNKYRHPLVIPLSVSDQVSIVDDVLYDNRSKAQLSKKSKNSNQINLDRSSDSLSQLQDQQKNILQFELEN